MAKNINLEVTASTKVKLENVYVAEEYVDKFAPGVYVPNGQDFNKTRVQPNDKGSTKIQLYKSNACVALNPGDTIVVTPKDSTELYYYLSKDNIEDGGFVSVTLV